MREGGQWRADRRRHGRHTHTHKAHSGRRATSTVEKLEAARNLTMNTSYRKGAVLPWPGAEGLYPLRRGQALCPLTGLPGAMRCRRQQTFPTRGYCPLVGTVFSHLLVNHLPRRSGLSTMTTHVTPGTELLSAALHLRCPPAAKFNAHRRRKGKPLLE